MKDAKGHGSDARGGRQFTDITQRRGATSTGVTRTVRELQALRGGIDERHYPTRSVSDRDAAAALAQGHPKSETVPLGQSFAYAKAALARARTVALPPGAENRRKA